ncbi:divergent polysaccharide deacetylase family protein [Thioclava sp.]|uniref:divergent polysaccharide deacetylase family protein n=1 Tax=Thioclava sp. TaxID=1933450 RepID=UPI003AA81D61
MMASVLKGVALGTGVSVLALGAASVMAPLPNSTQPVPATANAPIKQAGQDVAPAASPVDVPAGSDFARGPSDRVPDMPNPAGAPLSAPNAAPRAPVSQSNNDQADMTIAGTDPGVRPVADPRAPVPQPQEPLTADALAQAPAPEQPIPVPPPGEVQTPELGANEAMAGTDAQIAMTEPDANAPDAGANAPADASAQMPPESPDSSALEQGSAPEPLGDAGMQIAQNPQSAHVRGAGSAMPEAAGMPPLPDVQDFGVAKSAMPDMAPAPQVRATISTPSTPQPVPGPSVPNVVQAEMPKPAADAPVQPAMTGQEQPNPELRPDEPRPPGMAGPAPEQGAPAKPRVITLGDEPRRLPGQPVQGFRSAPNVVVDRLPQIGAASEPATDATPEDGNGDGADQTPAADNPDLPPIERYALPFVHDDAKSLYSVVLIDPGTAAGGLDVDTIAALDFPVTIAIDPTRSDAAQDAQTLRAAGHEVAILAADLPSDATPEDLEVALEAWRQVIPEAVAVVERPKPVFQNTRKLARQMVSTLGREGMGLVTQDRGFDSANQIASSVGLPRAKVWRVLDGNREKAPVIERMLSRAGFEADRGGKIVVMMSAWPETVSALTGWASDAAAKYDLAPVSAVALQAVQPDTPNN